MKNLTDLTPNKLNKLNEFITGCFDEHGWMIEDTPAKRRKAKNYLKAIDFGYETLNGYRYYSTLLIIAYPDMNL